ncbi:peroxidase [Marchantia polymorpha subsp. ruderalis]|uniref:Peroxidase n=2 Tax=Marchantia polymorpha TaxID=3197 RepID=A0A176WBG1_MARPO|nr:hypothetical protein AXG93_3884s1180 [Marchantia polymorpha subsp. ruderalis]PTQ30465.1 hypothetical protein MARPO_0124s0038 [Marchantia polymorpha]BBN10353.1 hypothetical protein Mp_5g02850 [Marchantia polymorpha subsp. ruderalis]|eukprot:PTQ30465.1 hypothetical protein MARPO_0124s0038 [Marchantia polymorpha]
MAARGLTATLLIFALLASSASAQLSERFYNSTCPSGPAKVAEVVRTWITRDRTLAPALLRLHFHDCFVRGCDGSVLLDTVNGEKVAAGNINSLRGFEVIDDVKTKLEALCPGRMSCADILSLAARDAMVQMAGPILNWTVPLGRRDGVSSFASEANSALPPPFANFQQLVSLFSAKGFTTREMVVLSGSHTVGLSHCRNFQTRLYNFSATVATDPALEASFAAALKRQCKFGDTTTLVKMDQSKSVDTWDFSYYSNVLRGKVLFQSDDALKRTTEGSKIVQALNRAGSSFSAEFSAAMTKLSRVGVLTGTSGQIRRKCNLVN